MVVPLKNSNRYPPEGACLIIEEEAAPGGSEEKATGEGRSGMIVISMYMVVSHYVRCYGKGCIYVDVSCGVDSFHFDYK